MFAKGVLIHTGGLSEVSFGLVFLGDLWQWSSRGIFRVAYSGCTSLTRMALSNVHVIKVSTSGFGTRRLLCGCVFLPPRIDNRCFPQEVIEFELNQDDQTLGFQLPKKVS